MSENKQKKKAVGAKSLQSKAKKKPAVSNGTTTKAKRSRQSQFLKALVENKFNISVACEITGVSRRLFYNWRDGDPVFSEGYSSAMEARLDKWEECLHKNIMAGDATSVIFALKTKGKDRGYVERESGDKKVTKLLDEVLAGEITAREAAYKINGMGLPLPEVLKIELTKQAPDDSGGDDNTSSEELERRYQEAIKAAEGQRENFLPVRQAEVAEIKESMKHLESFKADGDEHKPL